MTADLLPDSRAREAKNVIRSPFGNLVVCYCANCGTEWGRVREEEMTFAFVLCNPCAETYGNVAGMMAVPDDVFFAKVAEARREAEIADDDPAGFAKALEDPSTPLGKLAAEWKQTIKNNGRK